MQEYSSSFAYKYIASNTGMGGISSTDPPTRHFREGARGGVTRRHGWSNQGEGAHVPLRRDTAIARRHVKKQSRISTGSQFKVEELNVLCHGNHGHVTLQASNRIRMAQSCPQ